jgi:HJR/Mrr/RecB family endonuclease
MIFIVIVMIVCILGMCGVFDSKEVKESDKRWNEREKRMKRYNKGLIPDKDMAWWEKTNAIFLRIAGHRYKEGYDIDKDYQMLTKIILDNVDEILMAWEDGKIEDYGIRYNCGSIREAINETLTYVLSNRSVDKSSFFEKYLKVIVIADRIDDVIQKLHMEHDMSNVKEIYLKCVAILKNEAIKNRYLEKLKMVECQEQAHKQQQLEREKEECKRRHIEHVESAGGFVHVKTGEDYERFVKFCVNDAGHTCKKVGGTGDYGADLIADVNGKKLIIQCKFYSTPVGYDAVQQVYAAKSIYKGTWCCVVSNAGFTRQAIVGGRKLGIKLLSHVDIAEYLKSLTDRC